MAFKVTADICQDERGNSIWKPPMRNETLPQKESLKMFR